MKMKLGNPLTTLLYDPSLEHPHIPLLNRHLTRLAESTQHTHPDRAAKYSSSDVLEAVNNSIEVHGKQLRQRVRVELIYDVEKEHFNIDVRTVSFPDSNLVPTLVLDTEPTEINCRVKTTQRGVYTSALQRFKGLADDVLLYNSAGNVTETCIANIAIRRDEKWITPYVEDGLIDGIQRSHALENGSVQEGQITLFELEQQVKVGTRLHRLSS